MQHRISLIQALVVAGLVTLGGVAQAQTSDAPVQAGEASTMTRGVPNAETTNSPYPDGTVITTYRYYQFPATTAYVVGGPPLVIVDNGVTPPNTTAMGAAAGTSDVPDRAGEASTISRGAPNVSTNNHPPYSTMRLVGPGTYYLY